MRTILLLATTIAFSPPSTPDAAPKPPPAPTMEQLAGTWSCDRGGGGTITLVIAEENSFTWSFVKGDQENVMKGKSSIDKGLLVLAADESQMVGATTFSDGGKEMNFMLAGGPEGDPGLNSVKKS